ncbi:Sel1 repeat [Leishmania donovani]|uniref:Sel1_repeat_putative/Pfam:PF08238 n=1 Tax=Leishmania donovani TaxID=5661 RepID=A0A6J8F7D7_LEIDO|nr:Sel1 repeat [Leishmania donovani]VDZ42196.1 Sel1_repeat_putative/Pfam:PF08238 [Leishmania donovani]
MQLKCSPCLLRAVHEDQKTPSFPSHIFFSRCVGLCGVAMGIRSISRRGCRGSQLRCSLLCSIAAAVAVLAILASVATQPVLAEAEDDASWQPMDARGRETIGSMAHAPAAHVDASHAPATDDSLTPAGSVLHRDDAALGAPEPTSNRQERCEEAAGHSAELCTDTVSADRAAESDSVSSSAPRLPSEALTDESVVVERHWSEPPPPQQGVPSQAPPHGAQYSGEGRGWQLEQQQQAREPTDTMSSAISTDGTGALCADDAPAAAPAKKPATASSSDVGVTAASANAVPELRASHPTPPPEDLATPARLDEPPAFDEAAASTLAWEERGSLASQQPPAEVQETYDVPQQSAGEASDSAAGGTEAWEAHPSTMPDRASDAAQVENQTPLQGNSREPHEHQQVTSLHCDAHTTVQCKPACEAGEGQHGAAAEAAQQEASSTSTAETTPASLEAPTTWCTSEGPQQTWAAQAHEGMEGKVPSDSASVPEAQEQPAPGHHRMHQQRTGGGEAGGDGAKHSAGDTAADDEALGGTAGASVEEVRPTEVPPPEAEESTAEEHASAAEPATYAATAEASETGCSVAPCTDDSPSHVVKAAAVVTKQALAERRANGDGQGGSDVPMTSEENGEAAAYAQPTDGQTERGDVTPAADVDTISHEEGAMKSEEAVTQFWEGPDDTAAATAEIAFKGEAEDAVSGAAVDLDEVDGDGLKKDEEQPVSSSTASATISAPSSSTAARYHRYEHDVLHPPSPPPSRLALSYLYYHALEALYVNENVTLFVQRARDVAPYGHARLNWLLGVLHAYGIGVPRSERDALMYYSFAAMEAVPEAHMALGYRYKLGLGVVASCESALAHYREAADAVAMTYDGTAAASGGGAEPMTAGAKTVGSGKGGRSGSMSFFAYRDDAAVSDMRKQRRLDLISLKYQADIGNVDALLTLGYLLLKGDYQVVRDGRRAAAYFQTAAGKGSARAHGALGQLYMAGDPSISPPLLPDLRRALHHFRLGALQNDALSLNGMGFLHAVGYLYQDKQHSATGADSNGEAAAPPSNGPPDFATAAQYFYRSHCAEGLYNLGVLFLHGRGVAPDKKQARRLFERAAKQGSVLAQWQLANMLSEATEDGGALPAAECERALALYQRTASFGTWQHRAPGNRHSGGRAGVGADNADLQRQPQRHGQVKGKMGADGDRDARLLEATRSKRVPSHDGSGSEDDGDGANDGDATDRLYGFVRPRSEAEYQVLLAGILDRLHAVEESLLSSDEDEGPTTTSLASFVELLSLAETGDAAASWLAVQYVDDYLEVADTPLPHGRHASKSGAVPLFWPLTAAPGRTPQYLSGEAAASELLYHLLQRTVLHHTHTHTTLGAAYLRLGNFYYYGESPQYGVDMERALAYYRIAGDHHHNAQALFNVGFMYQLGLHKAPRATRVVQGMSAQELMERPEVLRHYTNAPVGAEWKVHSNPPEYLRTSPAFHLTLKAAANAWNRASADPMARGVDVYLAWKYYTASLRQEERGSMAVQFALAVLNVQWSLRHFGISRLLPQLGSSASPAGSPSASAHSASSMAEAGADEVDDTLWTGAGGAHRAHQGKRDVLHGPLGTLTTTIQVMWNRLMENAVDASGTMLSWYKPLEDAVLYGAISVVVVGLLVRHHVA